MKSDQKYLVVEQLDSKFRVSSVFLSKSNELILLDSEEIADLNNIKKTFSAPYVILALDSKHATTVEKEVTIGRLHPNREVTENEIDQIIFKVLWEFLNEHRNKAAKKMDVTDLDIVLSEIEIKEVFLGSKNILSPIGFKGEKVTFRFRGTLIPRSSLEYIESLRVFGHNLKAVERFAVVSSLSSPADFFVHSGNNSTEVFSITDKTLEYKEKYPWGVKKIVVPVSENFSINEDSACQILEWYFNGCLSENFSQAVKKKIKPALDELNKTVKSITKRRKVKIMVNVPKPFFEEALGEYNKAEYFDTIGALESKGFNVIIKKNSKKDFFLNQNNSALVLAGSNLFSPHHENLNRMLRRRSRWLVPHS
jgi:hypothetical protein